MSSDSQIGLRVKCAIRPLPAGGERWYARPWSNAIALGARWAPYCAGVVSNDEVSDEFRRIRRSAQGHDRHHQHNAAQEGHQTLLDEWTQTARSRRRTADRPRLHLAVRAGARRPRDAG